VAKDANKIEIKKAIEEIFGVTVIKVTTTRMRPKEKAPGTVPRGPTASWKKAVVKLSADSKTLSFSKAWHKGRSEYVDKNFSAHHSRPQTDDRLRLRRSR
jgi:ribosomal protein L23